MELPDGQVAHYRYDAFGRRIKKTVVGKSGQSNQIHPDFGRVIDDGSFATEQHATPPQVETVTEFLWQGNHLIAESSYQVSGDNQRVNEQYRSFIYEPQTFKPLVQLEGEGQQAEAYHYQLDHLGTPLALTRHNGATVWQMRYRAYGNVWQKEVADLAAPIETPLRFQGQYWDAETGLHYNRHRYYQPDTGRFISPDPIGLAGGINNYQYAPNPIGWVDPLGLMASECPDKENRFAHLSAEERRALLDQKAEANAKRKVQEYEQQYGMHTIEKHGPEIPDVALKQRAIDGTNPTTGRTPMPPRGNPSSQFHSWKMQLHAINDAMTRKTRGLSQHTGEDQNRNPIVRGNLEGGGRGYKPNRSDPQNPILNEK